MRLISEDDAFRILSAYYHHRTETQADALREALELVPEAVVRCKDCIHEEDCLQMIGERIANAWRRIDFCSYGERGEA